MGIAFAFPNAGKTANLLTPKSEVSKVYCIIVSVEDDALGIVNRDGETINLVRIYDESKALVLTAEGNGTAQCTVDIESLAAGNYTCTIVTAYGNSSAPFTK